MSNQNDNSNERRKSVFFSNQKSKKRFSIFNKKQSEIQGKIISSNKVK